MIGWTTLRSKATGRDTVISPTVSNHRVSLSLDPQPGRLTAPTRGSPMLSTAHPEPSSNCQMPWRTAYGKTVVLCGLRKTRQP